MQPFTTPRLLALALLSLCLGLAGCGSSANGAGCSEATLKGTYIYAYEGFQISGDTAAQRVPLAYAGRDIYNGDGTMTGIFSGGVNGVADGVVTSTGTYTIEADCTGVVAQTDSTGNTTHWDVFVLNNGSELSYVQTDPGWVASGREWRQ